ncbi:DUF7716 domain-containing protein [Photobacterium damselae subsp. damselae]|uniref:DUF7716 domain-containing protein n=1 Tax=Photobacterium damselae TaxID=38293 RepID=UPI00165D964A|nr:hypothetical protein [Photobacterium damselae]MCG9707130.1 hypothetical protein [Photobacterium damselae]
MAIDVLTTLAKVLLKIEVLPWSEDMKCMVLAPEGTDDPDDAPNVAKANGLKYALTISNVQDIKTPTLKRRMLSKKR